MRPTAIPETPCLEVLLQVDLARHSFFDLPSKCKIFRYRFLRREKLLSEDLLAYVGYAFCYQEHISPFA